MLRPRQGRLGLLGLLAELRAEPAGRRRRRDVARRRVAPLAALARARGLVVVVSDFRGPRDWEAGLRSLRARHGVLAVEVRDPRELELPPVGDVWMVDPETGRQIVVNTSRRKVRRRFAEAAAAEREEVAAALRRAGADHLVLSTGGDWLRDLAAHLRRADQMRRGAMAAGGPGRAAAAAHAVPGEAARREAPVAPDVRRGTAPAARRGRRRGARVTFREPAVLLGLALLPVALLAYARCSAAGGARPPRSATRR